MSRHTGQDLILGKSYIFHKTSDEGEFYIKIVALNKIYNFIVLSFSFKVDKCLNN